MTPREPLSPECLQAWREPGYTARIDALLAEHEERRQLDFLLSEELGLKFEREMSEEKRAA